MKDANGRAIDPSQRWSLLNEITKPADLRVMSPAELEQLGDEIRKFLISNVSRTGGHLGPNLGVVELTMAVHIVFDSPADPIIFDTGHQSYVHKILTGRAAQFPQLRQKDGLSGYPSRAESEHDWVENSHASASLSWAEGMARGFKLRGEQRTVVAVIGDGALTGGMAWEALNNIALDSEIPLVVVVNDNGRSYSPTVGGVSQHLAAVRTDRRYEEALNWFKTSIKNTPVVGKGTYELLHGMKAGLKDLLAPQGLFADLGLKYLGPVDGHDLNALVTALQQAKGYGGPVIVHAITRKGRGFKAAEEHDEDLFHTVGQIDDITGRPLVDDVQATWTDAFADEIVAIAEQRPDVVALTAAMLHPTGLARFAAAFPERVFDVGIAEQHAVASAAGMAKAGLHPVVAVYSTFLNRAFDQVLMDVALHDLGVTFVLDRAGITGPDGASHNGMWDTSMLGMVPGLRLAAPRDQERLTAALREAVDVDDAPTVIRFSKERMPDPIPALRHVDGVDVLARSDNAKILIVGYGQFMGMALSVANRLEQQGIGVTVVDPLWALPVNAALVELAAQHEFVVTIEDGLVVGGLGSQLEIAMDAADVDVPVRQFGIPQRFLAPASRSEVLADLGLTDRQITQEVMNYIATMGERFDIELDSSRRSVSEQAAKCEHS